MHELDINQTSNSNEDHEIVNEIMPDDKIPTTILSQNNKPSTIHMEFVVEGDSNTKDEINTDTEHFDALFARSKASLRSPSHLFRYGSFSPSNSSSFLINDAPAHLYAKPPLQLLSSPLSKQKQSHDITIDISHPQSISSTSNAKSQQASSTLALAKRKKFSVTHEAQTFLQSPNIQSEQLEPLARSCSYKRPQSLKKYRQNTKEEEKGQQQYFSPRKYSATLSQNNHILHPTMSDSFRKTTTTATTKISAADLMVNINPDDRWSSLNTPRSMRIGSLTFDQLKLPIDGDEEIYLVRQFHTTSKGFINRGDSFKRSFKRSGSISRRSSIRANLNVAVNDTIPSQEHDVTDPSLVIKDTHTSTNSLTNSARVNFNGLLDSHFIDNSPLPSSINLQDQNENDDDDSLVEHIQTEDGRVQEIHVYQVYLLGMSGTGKYSLMRQFKTTEYRGTYEYSSSIDDDPDNTVSIMLDGIESRLHIITIDIDQIKSSMTGDIYVVVYSIADRHSFQTAIQFIKNIRDNELKEKKSTIQRYIPIILVGNKSDLVRKRSVTKETARHAAFKYNCKFIETSAAVNDKVDDLLAGTLKQIRINEQIRNEERRRLTLVNQNINVSDLEMPTLTSKLSRKSSTVDNRNSKTIFSKLFNIFRKKPSKLSVDVENLNTGIG